LATLGAVITVGMISFSPFLQQLVAYPTNLAEQPLLDAKIPRAVNFTLLSSFYGATPEDEKVRKGLKDLAGAYFVAGVDVLTPITTCPTTHCYWENYTSIDWCSKCRNVTGYLSDCVIKDQLKTDSESETQRCCQLFVNNSEAESEQGLLLMNQTSLEDDYNTSELSYRPGLIWATNISTFVADDGSVIEEPINVILYAKISRVDAVFQDLYHSDQPALRIDHISECALTLCEREYTAATEFGKTLRVLTATDYGKRFDSGSCWRPENSAEDVVFTIPDGGYTRLNESERAFCPVDIYHGHLQPKFVGPNSRWYYNLTRSYQKHPDPSPASNKSFSSVMEDTAMILTDFGVKQSNHNAVGKAYMPQVTVRVRWQWIALPAFLELATVVLFLSTVFYSRHVRVPIWKSSLLAICYHDIEDLQEKRVASLLSEMDKASSTASVQISRSGDNRGFALRRIRHQEELTEERQQE
jgi:hypothetical protein